MLEAQICFQFWEGRRGGGVILNHLEASVKKILDVQELSDFRSRHCDMYIIRIYFYINCNLKTGICMSQSNYSLKYV